MMNHEEEGVAAQRRGQGRGERRGNESDEDDVEK